MLAEEVSFVEGDQRPRRVSPLDCFWVCSPWTSCTSAQGVSERLKELRVNSGVSE